MFKLIQFLIFILLLQCGYKIDKQQSNYFLTSLKIEGNLKEKLILENYLKSNMNEDSEKNLFLEISLLTEKKTKTKSKTGKVLTYTYNVNANVKAILNNKSFDKTFGATEDYEIGTHHSTTINNEKRAKNLAIEEVSNKIINYLSFNVN